MSTLDIYQRTDGLWAWRLTAPNGNIIATDGGQGYENKHDCELIAHAIAAGVYAPMSTVDAAYAATHARLADDPEYQRLKQAADQEAEQTPNQYLHRNTFTFYIETHTPLFGQGER
ncbi:YegP family protein [Microbacterium sp. NPDC058021]|uniref:YegP family protein n=1 Tax=Microbacterium sp. NPDC058021 TaxID=3346306 RepID=UPI0036DD84D1